MKSLALGGRGLGRRGFGKTLFGRRGLGRRSSVALLFALSLAPIMLAMATGIDMARLADGRATLQEAVDNAALSGASSYSVDSTAFNALAITSATSSFCNSAPGLPEGFNLVTSGTANGTAPQGCNANPGPSVAAVTAGYRAGTPGIASGSGCRADNTVIAGITCGFIVTVTATATMAATVPILLGATRTISVTGIALNPFVNIANAFKTTLNGSAINTNSLWLYPLLLNSAGKPDFTTNPGGLPGLGAGYTSDATPTAAGCTDSPSQYSCGQYTMLADTAYGSANSVLCPSPTTPCNPGGSATTFLNGVVQNPAAPTAVITATTPIGIAFQSLAGGSGGFGYAGYTNPTQASNGCYYQGGSIYNTAAQTFSNGTNNPFNPYGGTLNSSPAGVPALAWPLVAHWFFSSYLANNLPPSESEILSQSSLSYNALRATFYNLDVPTIGNNHTATTPSFVPLNTTCMQPQAGTNIPYDQFLTTAYPSTGPDNRSLFILVSSNNTYIPPISATYNGHLLTKPAGATGTFYPQDANSVTGGTPGATYADLSCQAYGSNVFTFYWNDMGGGAGPPPDYGGNNDDLDYGNGSVQITCSGTAHVVLIG